MNQTIHSILAISENRVIGDSQMNDMPWRIPGDLKYFREMTTGGVVVMGRKTWESLPFKPLPGRVNIVVTRQADYEVPDTVHLASSVEEAIELAKVCESKTDKVWCIGGAELYKAFEPHVDSIFLTVVHDTVPGNIVYHIDSKFEPVDDVDLKHTLDVEFLTWNPETQTVEHETRSTGVSRVIVSMPKIQ